MDLCGEYAVLNSGLVSCRTTDDGYKLDGRMSGTPVRPACGTVTLCTRLGVQAGDTTLPQVLTFSEAQPLLTSLRMPR